VLIGLGQDIGVRDNDGRNQGGGASGELGEKTWIPGGGGGRLALEGTVKEEDKNTQVLR
jgi:hypothetical protein